MDSDGRELPSRNDRQRRALLLAGEEVITERSFAFATPEDVAQRADVSLEVFHAHFQSMGALLRALSEHFTDQMLTVIDQATRSGIWSGAAARDVVEVAVRSILDVVIERRGLVRAFLAHGTTDPSLARDLRRIGTHMAQRVVATFAECTNIPARPSRAIAFSLLLAVSLAHHTILVGDEWSGVSFSKEQLTEEATRAICAYLGLDGAARRPEHAIDPTGGPTEVFEQEIDQLETSEYRAARPNRNG
jgi:AcrR family transcriptional regulator